MILTYISLRIFTILKYEEFLRFHNGGLLFNGPDGGDGLTLYTTDQILEKVTYNDYPEGWFPIADGYYGCYLVITQQNVDGGYLFWMEVGVSFEEDMFLGMSFI